MGDMAESLVNDFSPSDPSSLGLAWAPDGHFSFN